MQTNGNKALCFTLKQTEERFHRTMGCKCHLMRRERDYKIQSGCVQPWKKAETALESQDYACVLFWLFFFPHFNKALSVQKLQQLQRSFLKRQEYHIHWQQKNIK